jgi:lipoic acid synthetase
MSVKHQRLPSWIRQRAPGGERYRVLKALVQTKRLHTVCEEAQCPNMGECWEHGAATFMLMGDVCTRQCHFCAVDKGQPGVLDPQEPENVAAAAAEMQLDYVVLTSVDRDDLPDQGANHLAQAIEAIHRRLPRCKIDILVPDFRGVPACVARVVKAPLTVFAHNLETVPRLYKPVRPAAIYANSLRVLALAKEFHPGIFTKSGLMLGLGETREELQAVFADLRGVNCDILTLGQYLRPSAKQLPVQAYITPQEFAELKEDALRLGFRHVESGPLVRSSYHAWEAVP